MTGGGVVARQFPVLTWEREWFQRTLDRITAALGEDAYQAAYATGARLTYDDAVATGSRAIDRLTRH